MFAANSIFVNLDKMNIMKFITKNSAHSTVHIAYEEKCMEKMANTKFMWFTNCKPHKLKEIYRRNNA